MHGRGAAGSALCFAPRPGCSAPPPPFGARPTEMAGRVRLRDERPGGRDRQHQRRRNGQDPDHRLAGETTGGCRPEPRDSQSRLRGEQADCTGARHFRLGPRGSRRRAGHARATDGMSGLGLHRPVRGRSPRRGGRGRSGLVGRWPAALPNGPRSGDLRNRRGTRPGQRAAAPGRAFARVRRAAE